MRDSHSNEMVSISAGKFLMGSIDGSAAEAPVHEVSISSFQLDATLVTNEVFTSFVEEAQYVTDAENEGAALGFADGTFRMVSGISWRTYAAEEARSQHPVVLVSQQDALAFAKWAGKRLPTETEWEFAMRGGIESALYPWGDEAPDERRCTFARDFGTMPGTSAVTSHAPNAFGIYDAVGNVWQWCSDRFESYELAPVPDAPVVKSNDLCVRRGGAWNVVQPFRLRCANRGAYPERKSAANMGFRCARST